ncbi:hypothetical protein AeRB84_015313 [Aphanomyces euteiches]|nr:hypothetical protein AeRB84_015313 [Aphanomyces euteiches]
MLSRLRGLLSPFLLCRRLPPVRLSSVSVLCKRLSFWRHTKPKVAPLTHVLPSPNAPDDGAVASVAYSTDSNSTTLEVAPLLASRLAASRDGIPPPTCAIGLAPSLPPVALTDLAASLSCPAVRPSPTLASPQPPVATTASPTVLPCPATQRLLVHLLCAQPALEPSHHGGRLPSMLGPARFLLPPPSRDVLVPLEAPNTPHLRLLLSLLQR